MRPHRRLVLALLASSGIAPSPRTLGVGCTAARAPPSRRAAPPPPEVRVRFRQREVLVREGETLRSALLRRGLTPHNGRAQQINCRGLGTCGTCAVEIVPTDDAPNAAVLPSTRTRVEDARLSLPPHAPPLAPRLRLACQCRVVARADGDATGARTGAGGAASAPAADGAPTPPRELPVLHVRKHSGFWGQHEGEVREPTGKREPVALPFGGLEFVLDAHADAAPGGAPPAADAGEAARPRADVAAEGAPAPAHPGADGQALQRLEQMRQTVGVCACCLGSEVVPCPACDGRGEYDTDPYVIPDLPPLQDGSRVHAVSTVTCSSCHGAGQVVCRACFEGDGWDVEAVRARMRRKPD